MKETVKRNDKNKPLQETGASAGRSGGCKEASDAGEREESHGMEDDGFDFLVHSIDPYSIRYPQR